MSRCSESFFVAKNRIDFAIRTKHGMVFSVQGSLHQFKLVKCANHSSKLKLLNADQTVVTIESGDTEILNNKLDQHFLQLSKQTQLSSKLGMIRNPLLQAIVLIAVVLAIFGYFNLSYVNLSSNNIGSLNETSSVNPVTAGPELLQSPNKLNLNPTIAELTGLQLKPTPIQSEANVNGNSEATRLDLLASQLEHSNLTTNEQEILLEFLETIQTNEFQGLTDELINTLPTQVVDFLIQSGILTVVSNSASTQSESTKNITTLPNEILEYYRDESGIASIPRENSWIFNKGLITLPLPGGGDIKSVKDFADFGLSLK